MNIVIYYFSGTGNCLAVAKRVSAIIKGRIVPIPEVVNKESIEIDASSIGIVFPTYLPPVLGIPLIVERFVRKLGENKPKYLFAICTCGGYEIVNALPTLVNLSTIVKTVGGKLSARYSVRLPMNNLDYAHIPVPINTDQETILSNCREKLEIFCRRIAEQKAEKNRLLKSCFNLLMTPMYRIMRKSILVALREYAKESEDCALSYSELIPLTDRSIQVNEKCNGCAICKRVCPAQNIELVNNRPVWKHHCEMCFACDEWCPQSAIQHWSRAKGVKYHHPEVNLKDMLLKIEK